MKFLILTALILGMSGCMSAQRAREASNAELTHEFFKQCRVWGKPSSTVVEEIYHRGGFSEADWLSYQEQPGAFLPAQGAAMYGWLHLGQYGPSGTTIYTPRGAVTVHSGGGYVSVR